jgi:cytochrome c6
MKMIRLFLVVLVSMSLALPSLFAVESAAKEKKEGAGIFKAKCQSCHGPEGKADTAMAKNMKVRSMHSEEVQKQSKEELVKITTDGKGKMPAFKGKLSKDQIDDVVDYIKGLKK